MIEFLRRNAPYLSAGAMMTFASSFGQTFFISVFAGHIQSEFSLSHGEWGGLYAMATTTSAILMIWAGNLTDHFRARIIGPIALIFLAIACFGMSVSTGWFALLAVIFMLRFFGQGMLSHIAIVAMARWYVARRGKALSIASLGYVAGEACLPLLFVMLMGMTDWRNLWVVAAVVLLAFVPILRRLLRLERTPKAVSEETEATGMRGAHWKRGQALAHPLFWLMVPSIAGASAFLTALFFHQVHLAEVKGWTHAELVALFPIYSLTGVLGMLASGWAIDKYGSSRIIPFCQLPIAAGFAVLWATSGLAGAIVGYVLIGISHGLYSTLFSAFWAEYYGTRFLGGIKSVATACMVFGSAIGPGITGFAIDLGYDFPTQMLAIGAYFMVASFCIWVGIRKSQPSLPTAA